ncbi:protein arginine methyltransferase 10 [Perkinsus chesapeaki]|uniref:Protein arginine methyltransferase 10 n=1 Tax=Perkinsus chesapeaki TaxID=330153 RepID=A0A7J6LTI0_PERCH|nr:protein arginine methyltransferase 10 [Perkinsus chesapeaki]
MKWSRLPLHIITLFTCNAAAPPPQNATTTDKPQLRRLAVVTSSFTQLAIDAEIRLNGATTPATSSTKLHSGVPITSVELYLGVGNSWSPSYGRLNIVDGSVSADDAWAGACAPGSSHKAGNYVNSPWSTNTGMPTATTANSPSLVAQPDTTPTEGLLNFRMGGEFKLCYTDTGTFGAFHGDVPSATLLVTGIYTDCDADDCLAKTEMTCYLLRKQHSSKGSCEMDFTGANQGFYKRTTGNAGKATWTAEWATTYTTDGVVSGVTQSLCGTGAAAAQFICPDGEGCSGGSRLIAPEDILEVDSRLIAEKSLSVTSSVVAGKYGKMVITIPQGMKNLDANTFRPYTVAACYCPSYDNSGGNDECDQTTEYTQSIGVVHYYTADLCAAGDDDCSTPYIAVAADHLFKIRIGCPSDACANADNNRFKLQLASWSDPSNTGEAPSWSDTHICKTGSMSTLIETLPDSATADLMSGGARQDYKEFGSILEPLGFAAGENAYERRSFHAMKYFDICYCDSGCNGDGDYFKVGILRLLPFRLASAATDTADRPFIQYVNEPAAVALYKPEIYEEALGFTDGGIIKIVDDSSPTPLMNSDCAARSYDNALLDGLTASSAASEYKGATNNYDRLMFNAGDFTKQVTVKKPGIMALCYCGIISDNACADGDYWVVAGRFTVRGPDSDQNWIFSTFIVFRFELTGWGLSNGDTIRIVEPDAKCTDNNNSPVLAVATNEWNCPDVTTAGCTPITSSDDIPLTTSASDRVDCDAKNQCSGSAYIASITVMSDATTTRLTFASPPKLDTGDWIVLTGNGYACGAQCSDEQLSSLMGMFPYGDSSANDNTLQDTYDIGHQITKVSDTVYSIPLGWSNNPPSFTVSQGEWKRTNKAHTREELKGLAERSQMKVCWAPSGLPGKYLYEVGRLSVVGAAVMKGVGLHVSTSTAGGVRAPVIISFQTAGGSAGLRYSSAAGRMALRIMVKVPAMFDIHYGDVAMNDIAEIPEEDEIHEANQLACGKIFREMWSDDADYGFPVPQGCYYRNIRPDGSTITSREITVIFVERSGLRPGQNYQLVVVGSTATGANYKNDDCCGSKTCGNFGDPDDLRSCDYVHLLVHDDIDNNPYSALEMGRAQLSTKQGLPSAGTATPSFGSRGFTLVGGTNGYINAGDMESIEFDIKGGDNLFTGAIKAGYHIRVMLWPLTEWKIGASCNAVCLSVPPGEDNKICGEIQSCIGEPVVEGFQNNKVRIQLPPEMPDLVGDEVRRLSVIGISIPSGGFFPGRLGAEVTDINDEYPYYIESVGDYLWKSPDSGRTIARLVDNGVDGNAKPYKSDQANVIYAQLILGSTIFTPRGAAPAAFAKMTLTLPSGYECVGVEGAEVDLHQFGDAVPQGRGTLESTYWSFTDNKCIFTLPENGVVYAGSSVFLKVTVNNPANSLSAFDDRNLWKLDLAGAGDGYSSGEVKQATTEVFKGHAGIEEDAESDAASTAWSSNKAVLGKTPLIHIEPSSWLSRATHLLRVFFSTEQDVGIGGKVEVVAPAGFIFTNPCGVRHLDSVVYATGSTLPTHRIMGVENGCTKTTVGTASSASITVNGRMTAGLRYAFGVMITNPTAYSFDHQESWLLYTRDADGRRIDGSFGSGPLNEGEPTGDHRAWGMYGAELVPGEQFGVSVTDMRPRSLSFQYARVTVAPVTFPAEATGSVRVTAPQNFIWRNINSVRFAMHPTGSTGDTMDWVGGYNITAVWPGGLPTVELGNQLHFASATYNDAEVYGFEADIEVPDRNPVSSFNEWRIEISWDGVTAESRPFVGVVTGPPVRALSDAHVAYTYNAAGKENMLTFRVRIETQLVSPGGGLVIEMPRGFSAVASCTLLGIDNGPSPFPVDAVCSYQTNIGPFPTITIAAGQEGITAGLYEWRLVTRNPDDVAEIITDDTTECGWNLCFTFYALEDTQELTSEADYRLSTQGFPIAMKMVEARVPFLSSQERLDTGRDDRPGRINNIIFAFRLGTDTIVPGSDGSALLFDLRGPEGFIFAEDCLNTVQVAEAEVFGGAARWPPEYATWPSEAAIVSCAGDASNALISILPGKAFMRKAAGLEKNELYVIRVGVVRNPDATPLVNEWTIAFNGETSEPFEGFELSTGKRAMITPVSTARTPVGFDIEPRVNPISIKFIPHQTVDPTDSRGTGGSFIVEAPTGFQFAHDSGTCQAHVTELPYYNDRGEYVAGSQWSENDYLCVVPDLQALDTLVTLGRGGAKLELFYQIIRLGSALMMVSEREYLIVVKVYNPTSSGQAPDQWKLQTYLAESATPSLALDENIVEGFLINAVLNIWEFTNLDEHGHPQVNGLSAVENLELTMQFPNRLFNGDVVEIQAPEGFPLEDPDSPGTCWNFSFLSDTGDATANVLPNSLVNCSEGSMTITIREPFPFPRDLDLVVTLSTFNPPTTPFVTQNWWLVHHYGGSGRTIQSSHAVEGWTIVPQLQNVTVRLVGKLMRATAISSVQITFTSVSRADTVLVEAVSPIGFDFTSATVYKSAPTAAPRNSLSVGGLERFVITDQSGDSIRFRASISGGDVFSCIISNLKLGELGGPTVWLLHTSYLEITRDEKVGLQGFTLPGLLATEAKQILSEYALDPVVYPIKSLWGVRTDSTATALFPVFLTQRVPVGGVFRVSGGEYQMSGGFRVTTADGRLINTTVVFYDGNLLIAQLVTEGLSESTEYRVAVECWTPASAAAGLIHWRLETWGPEGSDPDVDADGLEALPLNTDDGLTGGFKLVYPLGLEIVAGRSPPNAIIDVSILLTPGQARPVELTLVAPPTFVFVDDCLVSGGSSRAVVTGCTALAKTSTDAVGGRPTARLTFRDAISEPTHGLILKVITPAQTPISTVKWFVEGKLLSDERIGWGESSVQFDVVQMKSVSVTYGRLLNIVSQTAFTFRSVLKVAAGGELKVVYPPGLQFSCSTFTKISLPFHSIDALAEGQTPIPGEIVYSLFANPADICSIDETTDSNRPFFAIKLTETLFPGDYAFIIDVSMPEQQPLHTAFDMILLDLDGNVVDGATNVQGPSFTDTSDDGTLQEAASIVVQTIRRPDCLRWQLGVEVRFEFLQQVIPDTSGVIAVTSVLITLPPGFIHAVEHTSDVLNLQNFPVDTTLDKWVDFTKMDRLLIHVLPTENILKMEYWFRFPVYVPSQMPSDNIWFVSFCGRSGGCSSIRDSGVLATLPIGGFDIGDVHPNTNTRIIAFARPSSVSLLTGFGGRRLNEREHHNKGTSLIQLTILIKAPSRAMPPLYQAMVLTHSTLPLLLAGDQHPRVA